MIATLLLLAPAAPLAQAPTALLLPAALQVTSACDDFNRASGTNMGPDWNELKGDLAIIGDVGYGTMAGSQYMIHTQASAPYDSSKMSVDFLPDINGRTGQHVALIAGYADNVNTVYVKVQDDDSDGLYDQIYFVTGIDGATWSVSGSSALATPTGSGRMTLSFTGAGDTARCDIQNDASGLLESFSVAGLLSAGVTLGTEFGIGVTNSASFDDFELNGGCNSGPALAVTNLVAGATTTLTLTNGTAGSPVYFAYSIAGAGPTSVNAGPCGMVDVALTNPITLPPVTADPAGTASISAPVPPGTSGTTVWFQAFDLGSCTLSNGLVEIVG